VIEARIECECQGITLSDLDLHLTRGQVVFMDAAKARASKDMQRAWRVGAVAVKYVERFKERRKAPVAPHPLIPARGMVAAPPEPIDEATTEIVIVDPGEIAARVVHELGRNPITAAVRVEVGRQVQALEDRLVARVVEGVLASLKVNPVQQVAAQAPQAGTVPVDGDVPVFVPSKIDGLQADLGLESEKADEGVVSDAAAALRAARGAGKKRRTEKPE